MIRKFISEEIGLDYINWQKGDTVYITAPTGSGKTTFILNVLTEYATKQYKSILFVVNRHSLRVQVKKELADCNNISYETLNELDEIDTFGNLTIVTYQQMEQHIQIKDSVTLYNMGVNKWYDYVVFDEAHYFIEDSFFNPCTELVYKAQRYHFNRTVRIFISATLTDFISYNNENGNVDGNELNYYIFQRASLVWRYTIPTDYSHYSVQYFKDILGICTLINQDNSDDKWLIFVTQKKEGEFIRKNINVSSSFITSSTKNHQGSDNETLVEIITEQKFQPKVIIATSVIDNGINLHDIQLRNIVISSLSQTQFIQMLGRKRIDDNLINLYIDAKSLVEINGYKQMVLNKMIDLVYIFRESPYKANKYLFENPDLYHQFHSLFRYDTNKFRMNEIAISRIFHTNDFIKKIINRFKEEGASAYIKEQLSWINLEHSYSENNWIDFADRQNKYNDIKGYLSQKIDLLLDKPQQLEIRNYLATQFIELYGPSIIDRSSRVPGIKVLNKILLDKEYDYIFKTQLINKKTHWVINPSSEYLVDL